MSVAITGNYIYTGVFSSGYKTVDTIPTQGTGIPSVTKLRYAAFVYVNTPRYRIFGYFLLIFVSGVFGSLYVVQCLFFRVIISFLRAFLTASALH